MIPIERVERVELRDPNPIANTPLHLLSLSQVELELPPHETREANNAGLDCRVTNRVSERVSEKNNGPAPWNGSPCSHGQPQSLPCWLINYSVDACPWLLDGDVFRSASAP